jgi:hypothetical protein
MILRGKQHASEQLTFDQSFPQPTYNTNPYIKKDEKLQIFLLYLSGARDQSW